MKKSLLIIFASVACASTARADALQPHPQLDCLIAAERAFSKTSAEKGVREAFLEFLADDAIVFRPYPVLGKKWHAENPSGPGSVSWEPLYAEISHAGDLGYTTGPWQYRRGGTNDAVAETGHYAAVWRKQPTGDWRVAIDLTTTDPPGESGASFRGQRVPEHTPAPAVDPRAERAALLEAETAFSAASASNGAAAAYRSFAAEDIQYYRSMEKPVFGAENVVQQLAQRGGTLTWSAIDAVVAASGDLGYSYGTAELMRELSSRSSSYLRIWRKDRQGRWKVAVDMAAPIGTPQLVPVVEPKVEVAPYR
jgi:ketosteroid isomerase-like protein